MGCWGMGLMQSDEFCEIYHQFMEAYNGGKAVSEITLEILAKYHGEFDDCDGVMHDVYFALAKAEWMCCAQSEPILKRVKEIIESGANIEFYRDLGSDEKDLKLRRKKLDEFWNSLQTPRAKPRKRQGSPERQERLLPHLELGDCLAYPFEDGFRIVVILDRFQYREGWKEQVFCAILLRTFSKEELNQVYVLAEEIGYMNAYGGSEFLGKSSLRKIGMVSVPSHIKEQITEAFIGGEKSDFKKAFTRPPHITLGNLLRSYRPSPINTVLPSYKAGECYAYPYSGEFGYRIAIVLERFYLGDTERLLLCILKKTYLSFHENWLEAEIGRLGSYTALEFCDTVEWKKIGTLSLPKRICENFFGIGKYPLGSKLDFLTDFSSLPSMTLSKLFEARNMK